GITPSPSEDVFDHGTFRRYSLASTYVDSVIAAGGTPIILPESIDDAQSVLDLVDGLVLSGGSDLDPALYGDSTIHPTTYGVDPERDSFDIRVFKLAVEQDKPVLGICRGIQSINVALGGTLIQDIDSEIPENVVHRQQKIGKNNLETSHSVTIVDEVNPLFAAVGTRNMIVNSFHHQSVRDLAPGLVVTAVAEDGVIEGLWHPGMSFGMAVQWHPEMLAARHDDHAAIFRALVGASSGVPSTVR
ncbi:MAG TPA: gamma-glutamyl-gamma-aminobutyrate hydrolase family protein, partial [Thermomicrobiales bacterium]|nr:gamma-glutamyl-gamma-aminobutyrate hydrolase family protein [Thermomicrobiales bacterium]